MNIDLREYEVYKILEDKFGKANFRLFMVENAKGRKQRTGVDIINQEQVPSTNAIMVSLDEDTCIVPKE